MGLADIILFSFAALAFFTLGMVTLAFVSTFKWEVVPIGEDAYRLHFTIANAFRNHVISKDLKQGDKVEVEEVRCLYPNIHKKSYALYFITQDGTVTRTRPIMSKADADARAEKINDL